MNVTIYSPLDPTLIGGMRTWLEAFWLKFCLGRKVQLRIVHTGTRPSAMPTAYLPLSANPFELVALEGRRMPGTAAKLPSVDHLARAFHKTDLVYVDNGYLFQDVVALRAARAVGVPVVTGHHSAIVHDNSSAAGLLHNAAWYASGRRQLRRFDVAHALNKTDGRFLQRCGARNVAVVPLCIDESVFGPAKKSEKFTVLFVGRLHRQKGIDRLLGLVEAFSRVGDVNFRLIGAGPEEAEVQKFAVRENVTLLSGLDRRAVADEMRAAHVLVAPSRSETFGFVAAEALACGTPVLCSSTNGFRDLVDDSNGAIIEDADNTRSWVRAVDGVRAYSRSEYDALSMRAHTSVRRLSFETVASQMDALFDLASRVAP